MNEVIQPLTATESEVRAIRAEVQKAVGSRIHAKTAYLLACIARLLNEYSQFGKLTVRQVYYLLVTRGVIENSRRSYFSYDNHLTTGRKAGVIPWDAFEDRARSFHKPSKPTYDILAEDGPQDALRDWFRYALNPGVSDHYDICKWSGQPFYVEIWLEKDALAGFLTPLCESLGVGLVVSRGYTSYTFKREARQRFEEIYSEEKRKPVLLYLGDLDPSRFDVFRCLEDDLGEIAHVKRIGLHPEDVSQFGLVPSPIKESDPRADGFRQLFPELGDNVYELDALPPGNLLNRARDAALGYFDDHIEAENQRRVRHWRADFCDHQDQIRSLLQSSGIEL